MPVETKRYRAVALVVLGIIVVVLGIFVLIGLLEGDDTDEIDPQNGQVVTLFLGL
ncbi:hypothetical protein [Nocardioides pyridinolyticus]